MCPLILDPKNSSSFIVPFKIFFSLPVSQILISSGLIVTVNKSSFIFSLHSNIDPLISRLFSEMIAILIISFWQSLGSPKKFNLIELGSGNGEMIKIIIESFKNFPSFYNSCFFLQVGAILANSGFIVISIFV